MVTIIVVLALVAGGAYFMSQRDGPSSEVASSGSSTTVPKASASTDPAEGTASTTTPGLAWSSASDPPSGLSWKMPGTQGPVMRDVIGMVDGGPASTSPSLWTSDVLHGGSGPQINVTIWGPESGANQATVDAYLDWGHTYYHAVNTPYPKPVTIAGAPTTAVDASTDSHTSWTAAAAIDGSLVVVTLFASRGEVPDPKMFEELVASFTKG